MELVDRYIYAVTKQLQPNQKEDIEKELRGLIEDMINERTNGGAAVEADVEAVLLELGDPVKLADKYRGTPRYLIGPDFYHIYLLVLKIVLIAVGFGITVAFAVDVIVEQQGNAFHVIGDYIGSFISALFGAFAWVTIIFALNEHYGNNIRKLGKLNKDTWKPSSLPKIPARSQLIKPIDPILGIVFGVFFLILFNISNQLIGIYSVDSNKAATFIPLFQKDVLNSYLPVINVMFCISILKEFFKLIYGKWTISLAVINGIINAVSLIIALILFTNTGIWNADLASQLVSSGLLKNSVDANLLLSQVSRVFIAVLVFGYSIDTIVTTVKAVKHRFF